MTRGLACAAAAIAAACAVSACKPHEHAKASEPTPEPLADEATQAVEPEAPTGFIGVLTAKSQAEVVAPFATSVKQYLVSVGDRVEIGQKLAILDDAPLREALSKADADLKGAAAAYSSAASNADIQLRAFNAGVAAKATYLQAQGTTSEAKARYDGFRATYDATRTRMSKTTVVAQIAGKVAVQYIPPGGQVAEGKAILRVISSDELYVRFAIPTGETDKLAEGMPVDIQIASHGTQLTAHGKVTSIQPELDPIARVIFAEAELTGELPAGLQAGLVCRLKPAPGAVVPVTPSGSGSATSGSGSGSGSAATGPTDMPPATTPPPAPLPARPAGKPIATKKPKR